MSHSPEPWKVEPSDEHDGRYEIDHGCDGSVPGCDGLFREDAARIVACVNFCAGIPTEVLLRRGQFTDYGIQPIKYWNLPAVERFSKTHEVVVPIGPPNGTDQPAVLRSVASDGSEAKAMTVLLVGNWLCFNDFTNWSRVQRRAVWRTTQVLVPGEFLGTWKKPCNA